MTAISILGSGWLGLALARHFKQLDYTIKLSTRTPAKMAELAEFDFMPFLVDIDNLTDVVDDFLDADILIINITSKNLDSFRQLRQRISDSPIKKLLFVSSTSVYQNLNREVTEDEGVENLSHPLVKIENLLRDTAGVETTIIRFSGLIDNRRHPGRFFRNGKVVPQAEAPVNLIHRDDCIGLIDAIISQQCWGQVFNGTADTHPTKREFYSHARALLDMPPPEFDDSQPLSYKIVSNQKSKQLLHYQLQYPDLLKIRF